MVEIHIDFDIVLVLEIVNHITNVVDPNIINFALAHFYEDGRAFRCCGTHYRPKGRLVIQIECAQCILPSPCTCHTFASFGAIDSYFLQ